MATVYVERALDTDAATAWKKLREVDAPEQLMDMIAGTEVVPGGRVCTTADGAKLVEEILSVDDDHRRVAYTITESPFGFQHHSASMQVIERGGRAVLVWITDVRPDEAADVLRPVIEAETENMVRRL